MKPEQLKTRPIERIEMNMAHTLGPECRLVVWGIRYAGADEFVTALQIGGIVVERRGAPAESPDMLRLRAMREIVPLLPPNALRDPKGSAVAFFRYAGLPPDHCQKASLQS